MVSLRPLAEAQLAQVEAVFTDVDGTLTTNHKLNSSTIGAIETLAEKGVRVVLVTGRSAGWGECWLRTFPVEGVIAENGGLYWKRSSKGFLQRVYAEPEKERQANRKRLKAVVKQALRAVRGSRLSVDSQYTEVDLAIDYNEEAHLGMRAADELEQFLQAKGVRAVRSSVHVNCWIGEFDKLSMVKKFLSREWKSNLRPKDPRYVYAGDSFNDAPMFGGFSLSVGVANVLDILDVLKTKPAYVTRAREGAGFEELARAIVSARSIRKKTRKNK